MILSRRVFEQNDIAVTRYIESLLVKLPYYKEEIEILQDEILNPYIEEELNSEVRSTDNVSVTEIKAINLAMDKRLIELKRQHRRLNYVLKYKLTDEENQFVRFYYINRGQDLTMKEVADYLMMSQRKVERVKKSALNKFKREFGL